MDGQQTRQENQYSFPYHHISQLKKGKFSQVRIQPWGYIYMSYLEAALSQLEKLTFDSLLDIGCGDGKLLYEIRKRFPKARLYGNDYSGHAIAFAKAFNFDHEINFSTQTVVSLAQENGPFDIITAIEVLEHIPPKEIPGFCKDFAAALGPKSIGIITVPSDNRPVSKKHYQHFNEYTLRKTVAPHLEVTKIAFFNHLSIMDKIVRVTLSNRFFVLNQERIVNTIYRYYCRHLLHSTAKRAARIMAIVQKAA